MRRNTIVARVMAEPVRLAGCPDIILTRHAAYRFYVDRCGMDPRARGFLSPDYLAFSDGVGRVHGKLPLDTPLTDLTEPWVIRIMDRIAEDARG